MLKIKESIHIKMKHSGSKFTCVHYPAVCVRVCACVISGLFLRVSFSPLAFYAANWSS